MRTTKFPPYLLARIQRCSHEQSCFPPYDTALYSSVREETVPTRVKTSLKPTSALRTVCTVGWLTYEYNNTRTSAACTSVLCCTVPNFYQVPELVLSHRGDSSVSGMGRATRHHVHFALPKRAPRNSHLELLLSLCLREQKHSI